MQTEKDGHTPKLKILFRADAGPEIGYGHFIRSLALADMLKDDFDCVFYTQTPTDYQRKEAALVCPLVELPANDSRFELFLDKLNGDEIVVLDNYFYTTDYQRKIKEKGCKLVCVDDMHNIHYVADLVINHGNASPEQFSKEPYTRLCLGLDYALLRRPFLEAARKNIDRVKKGTNERVAICFGGSDPMHITEKALIELISTPSIQWIDVIVGAHFNAFAQFEDSRIHFHQNISAQKVADIFTACDVAIVSTSSVCIEALACGAKVAAGWYVDNQREGYIDLISKEWIIGLDYLGNTNFALVLEGGGPKSTFTLSNIKKNFIQVFKSLIMYENFKKSYVVSPFVFKNYVDLTNEEAVEVLQSRNDIEVRKWMVSTDEIPLENHLKFINGLKNSEKNFYWAVYQDNVFLGGISLTGMNAFRANSGIFLNPKLIGKGLGVKISICSLDFYFQYLKMQSVYSVIQKDNQNAIKLNQFLGCTFHHVENNFIPIELTHDRWMENRSNLFRLAFGKKSEIMLVNPLS